MTPDYTKLAKEWLSDEKTLMKTPYDTVCDFATFLNERASREECIVCVSEANGWDASGLKHTCHRKEAGGGGYPNGAPDLRVEHTDKPVCPDCGGAGYHYADDGTREVHKCYYGNDPTPSKAECATGCKFKGDDLHEPGRNCVVSTPSKALEELGDDECGLTQVFRKLNEVIRYVKELERKINT